MKRLITILGLVMFLSIGTVVTSQDNDTYISDEIQEYCIEIAKQYGVCPELLMAMIETESSGKPDATNGSCKGLMQISEKWHKDRMERLGVTDIYDSYGNILVGTDYLMELAERYGDIGAVLMYYNGDSNAGKFLDGTAEMSGYAKKILARAEELERLHGK